jgi:hypothetical protein
MTAPFGIAFYSRLEDLANVQKMQFGIYSVEPPSPHPLFTTYLVRATSSLGIVWIKGIGPDIENDAFGNATITAVDRVKDQVSLRYGTPEKLEGLLPGSTWEDPQYWTAGLASNERVYAYSWKRPEIDSLPEDIASVFVSALARDFSTTAVILEYSSTKITDADAEEEKEMSNLL